MQNAFQLGDWKSVLYLFLVFLSFFKVFLRFSSGVSKLCCLPFLYQTCRLIKNVSFQLALEILFIPWYNPFSLIHVAMNDIAREDSENISRKHRIQGASVKGREAQVMVVLAPVVKWKSLNNAGWILWGSAWYPDIAAGRTVA